MAADSGRLPPGHRLEEYVIERVLGQGGFGITYLALDSRLDRLVAIKEYFPLEWARRTPGHTVVAGSTAYEGLFQKYLDGFLAEAKTLAKLNHPTIVRVGRFIEGLGTAYMVMDYEEGQSLHDVLTRLDGPPTQDFIVKLTRPLLDALNVVHAADILHRDIKPGNIVIRGDGSPVLLDFGAARSYRAMPVGAQVTRIWSEGYTPPEQAAGEPDQGPWTDVYALAAVLYRAIGSKPPIDSLIRRDQGLKIPSAIQLGGGRYDTRLLNAIDWGLQLDTRARPQSIAEWRNGRGGQAGVEAAWLEQAAVAPTQPAVTLPQPPADRPIRTRPRAAVGVLAGSFVALVLAVVIGLALWPRREEPTAGGTIATAPTVVPKPSAPPDAEEEPVAKPLPFAAEEGGIVALGMVDGTNVRYQSNPDALLSDLRADARNQALEKAAAIFVERGAINDQYAALEDEIFSHVQLVERLSDDAQPTRSGDGLVYLPTSAVVRLQDLRRIVFRLSRERRLALIRAQGDPLISVAVSVRDAERGSPIERSALAENVIKQRIRDFGYRVASPQAPGSPNAGGPAPPQFAIESEAKLKRLSAKLPASGLTIEKYVLTSWTVKCAELSTGEDIYFDNQLPDSRSWADEDRALQEIGTLIADAFSQDFFAQHLPRASRRSELVLTGVQSPVAAKLIARDLLGLRSVVNVAAETGDATTRRLIVSWYDQGPGGEQSFDGTVLAPLRRKLGAGCFAVTSTLGGQEVAVRVSDECAHHLLARLEDLPTAALSEAPADRLAAVARSVDIMQKMFLVNPEGVGVLAARGLPDAVDVLRRARAAKVDL